MFARILSDSAARAGEPLQRGVLGQAGTLGSGSGSAAKLGAGEPSSSRRDLPPASAAERPTWALGFQSCVLQSWDVHPEMLGSMCRGLALEWQA